MKGYVVTEEETTLVDRKNSKYSDTGEYEGMTYLGTLRNFLFSFPFLHRRCRIIYRLTSSIQNLDKQYFQNITMSQILHTRWAFQFIPARLSGSPQPTPHFRPRPPNYPRAGDVKKREKSSRVYFSFLLFSSPGSPAQARGMWLEVCSALGVSLSQLELRRGKYTATDK